MSVYFIINGVEEQIKKETETLKMFSQNYTNRTVVVLVVLNEKLQYGDMNSKEIIDEELNRIMTAIDFF